MFTRRSGNVVSTLLAAGLLCLAAHAQEPAHSLDQLDEMVGFLYAVYPTQNLGSGQVQVTSFFSGKRPPTGGSQMRLTIQNCLMSGTSFPTDRTKATLPSCGEQLASGPNWLAARFYTARSANRIYVKDFQVTDGSHYRQWRAAKAHFNSEIHWTNEDALTYLRTLGPQYGPDALQKLLRNIPYKAITSYSNCRLKPETASFVAKMTNFDDQAFFEWRLDGETQGNNGKCYATFEPFGGLLVSLNVN